MILNAKRKGAGFMEGIVGMMIVYPIYKGMVKRKREKLAPEIMRLSEELMK